MTELAKVDKLETVTKIFTKTIEGEQQLASLIPSVGIEQIIGSPLFKDKMVLEVEGQVSAGYMVKDVITWAIKVSKDGTITIVLGEPKIFWVILTGTTKSIKLGIVTIQDIAMENKLREKAGEMMLQEALSGNILQEAKNNAQNTLQNLFLKANIQIKEVIIKGTGDIE